ncbi:MAG: TetR/AcrR family transcriptional regulator [Terriglobales bacterium]
MTRTADETRPVALLDAIVGYLVKHGVAEVSLRPLAKAVGSSPRVLLYYFGSKEQLLAQAIRRLRERQRIGFDQLRSVEFATPADACRAIWKQMSAPESLHWFQLSLETYTMALRKRRQFASYLRNSVEDWVQFIAEPLIRRGVSAEDARAYATVVIAGFRGFLLDYCATRDRKRIDRAVERWLESVNAISQEMVTRGTPPRILAAKKVEDRHARKT